MLRKLITNYQFAGTSMQQQSRPLLPLSMFSLILFVALGLCSPDLYAQSQAHKRQIPVVTEKVKQQSLSASVNAISNLKAKQSIMLAPQIAGFINKIAVSDNQQVKQGQLLFTLESAQAQAKFDEAYAYLTEAKRKLDEYKTLLTSNAITQNDIDSQQAELAIAQARLNAAQGNLNDHHIRAPFAGTIGLIDFSIGQRVNAGEQLLSLDNLQQLYLDLPIAEQHLANIAIGMDVSADSKAWPNNKFYGKITAISPRINAQSLNLNVRVLLQNKQLKLLPGMLMSANIALPETSQLVIPIQALEYSGSKRYVYLIDNQQIAKRTEVMLGARIDNKVLINQGLTKNDEIVVQGLVNMRDGIKVKVLELEKN